MKLDLGCTDELLPGFDAGVDIKPMRKDINAIKADLKSNWPFKDSSVHHFRAHDIIEHLPNHIHTMNELWRCLVKMGSVEIIVPLFPGTGSVQDPQHVSFWTRRSFVYYQEGHDYRERMAVSYGIKARFAVVEEQEQNTMDGPKLRIVLKAVK